MSASLLPSSCCSPCGDVAAVPPSSPPPPPLVRPPNCRRCSFGGLSSLLANAIENGVSSSLCSPSSSSVAFPANFPPPAMSAVSPPCSRLPSVFSTFNSEQSSGQHSRAESCLELEALAAVHRFAGIVQEIAVSEMLPRTADLIFVNVTTLEAQPFCLELTAKGWRVTSLRTDCMQGDFTRMELFTIYYQSLHQLMDAISPEYRNRVTERRKSEEEPTDLLASEAKMAKGSEC
ncbi:hypothetical protein niasHS_010640 [Heterodera schachtii]|uniref:GSKIP domain-containing protein n=1 Tax=Heterodera schachtii TaxID=97005 RepID=A0ABD2J2X4_HETSC